MHYAWTIFGVTLLVLVSSAGIRTAPTVLFVPFEESFGWPRTVLSTAVAVNVFLFGLGGPFSAAFFNTWGVRATVLAALSALCLGMGLLATLEASRPWQVVLLYGIGAGVAGSMTAVLGAHVSNRWFDRHRGLVVGFFSGA